LATVNFPFDLFLAYTTYTVFHFSQYMYLNARVHTSPHFDNFVSKIDENAFTDVLKTGNTG